MWCCKWTAGYTFEEMNEPSPASLARCEELLGYRFKQSRWLAQALTHSSMSHESGGTEADNETLEFFGDAILAMLVTEILFQSYGGRNEGELSKIRARLVRATTLARRARALGLGEFLQLGRGEERGGGRQKTSILADAFEAIVAAVYLDGGLEAAREFIVAHFSELLEQAVEATEPTDFKSSLQVLTQRKFGTVPSYRVIGHEGPEHDKRFLVEVRLEPGIRFEGWGRSKKAAEQEAAHRCWNELRELREQERCKEPGHEASS